MGGVDGFLREREAMIGSAAPGARSARRLSDLTDGAVSALAETALARLSAPWAVIALGGWGARRLLPLSDLDILIVTDGRDAGLEAALKDVLYPLWDAGLDVGHQVRARRDHLRMSRSDIDTLTATLTGRRLCGDAALAQRVIAEVATDAARRRRAVVAQLLSRERPGSPYLLEPDLKNGAGGQRDLDELTWLAAVLGGRAAHDPSALVPAGPLDAEEASVLAAAGERITEARWAVHRQSARPTSVLSTDLTQGSGLDLEQTQSALADVHHVLLRVHARLGRGDVEFDPRDGRPGQIAPARLFELLDAGTAALASLEEAAWAGLLEGLAPGFRALMALRRPALSHLYTVGDHCLRTATGIPEVAREHVPDHSHVGGSARLDPSLQTAALLHDVGKTKPGRDHASRGEARVRELAPRFGLSADQVEEAALLVREHLLLSETAFGRDIHDEDVILQTAARVGRAELVGPLLLLTIADSLATGPGAWTPWHGALVGELAQRLRVALDDESAGAGIAQRALEVRGEAVELVGAGARREQRRFIEGAPLRYLAGQLPADVVTHAGLAATVASSGDPLAVQIAVTPGPADGTWRASVAAADRPGLFAALCGAFALSGLDIMAADAYDAQEHVALDVFVVRSDTLASVEPATWAAFERSFRAALIDPGGLETRLAERRRHYVPRVAAETRVQSALAESYATAVKVVASDRVGLLYDIARAFADGGLDIRWARAVTQDGVARDVFHVTDDQGEPVTDPGVLGHLAMRIRERV